MHRVTLSPQTHCQAMESRAGGGENQSRLCSLFLPPWTPFPTELKEATGALLYPSSLQPKGPQARSGQRELTLPIVPRATSWCPRRGVGTGFMHRGFPSLQESRESASRGAGQPPTTMPQPRTLKLPCGPVILFDTQSACHCQGIPLLNLTPLLGPAPISDLSSPWTLDSPSVGDRWGRAGRDPAQ